MIIAFLVSTICLISRRDNGSLRNNPPKIQKRGAGKNYNNMYNIYYLVIILFNFTFNRIKPRKIFQVLDII